MPTQPVLRPGGIISRDYVNVRGHVWKYQENVTDTSGRTDDAGNERQISWFDSEARKSGEELRQAINGGFIVCCSLLRMLSAKSNGSPFICAIKCKLIDFGTGPLDGRLGNISSCPSRYKRDLCSPRRRDCGVFCPAKLMTTRNGPMRAMPHQTVGSECPRRQ